VFSIGRQYNKVTKDYNKLYDGKPCNLYCLPNNLWMMTHWDGMSWA